MNCPKCKSDMAGYEHLPEEKGKGRNLLWWVYFVTIGWLVEVAMWVFLFIPMLFIRMFRAGQKVTKVVTYGSCYDCGHLWRIRTKFDITMEIFITLCKIGLVLFVALFYFVNVQ